MLQRNQNSHFSKNPTAEISRSRFRRPQSIKFTANAGQLIPFYIDEVLPGDTMQVTTSKLIRMQTPATPFMDNVYADVYYFFVPNRLVWQHWKEFMGENTQSPWISNVEYSVPQILCPAVSSNVSPDDSGNDWYGWEPGTIADYLGIPGRYAPSFQQYTVSALPFRAYTLIWNEWFRDQNTQYPQNVPTGDAQITGTGDSTGLNQGVTGGYPLPVGKFRDYFTSCLPAPQKGPDVLLPLGEKAPVYAFEDQINHELMPKLSSGNFVPTHWIGSEGGTFVNDQAYITNFFGEDDGGATIRTGGTTTLSGEHESIVPDNLWTDLSVATASTVNQLRLAFQMQKIYEKMARGGSRYIEILYSFFGVTSPDSRLQRPEYLGGNRMLVNVNQVVQNSESATTPQGTTTAYSLTVDTHEDFTHSFVEHGFLIGLICFRYDHTYQQGIERFWTRKGMFDFYWPTLANIGEQPVYNREIFVQGNSTVDDEVFGYQEAWADYRYKPNRVAGEMRSGVPNSLDVWHLADYYTELPTLSDGWIREDKTNVDRVLAVTSQVSHQFFGDIYVENISTRAMPLFSIPGLIDHH